MEAKSVTGMIMGLFVAITVVAVIMVPTLNDVTYSTSGTVTNEGLCFMEMYGSDAEFTATWSGATPTIITIDGEDVTIPSADVSGKNMLIGNNGLYLTGNINRLNLYDSTSTTPVLVAYANNSGSMTITAADGDISFTNGETTKTYEITEDFYFIAKEGAYVQKDVDDVAYLSAQDPVYYIVASLEDFNYINACISGNIEDGFTVEGLYYDITSSNHVINYTQSSTYEGVYEFTGVTFDAEYTSGGTTVSATDIEQKQFVVPYEVDYEVTSVLTEYSGILSVIPLVIIAAIVLSSVALVATRRD